MNVEKVSKKDLVGPRLQRLLEEVENLSQNGDKESYEKLTKFIASLMQVGSKLEVTPDGKKVIGVKMADDVIEEVDFIEVLKLVDAKITSNIDHNAVSSKDEKTARKSLKDKMSQTIGVLLNEDKIVSELAERGVTDREFIDNAETEITRSQEKIDMLQPLLDEQKDIRKLFGNTVYSEVSKKYLSKSMMQELKDCKQAETLFKDIEEKLTKIKAYKDAMAGMDPDSNEFKANEKAIEPLYEDIKGLRQDIKTLEISGLDLKQLNNLNVKDSTSIGATLTDVQNKKAFVKNTYITDIYKDMKELIKNNFAKFELADEATAMKLSDQQVEDMLNSLDKSITSYESEIRYEKEYQAQTRNSIDKFNEKLAKKQELEDKFEIRQRQAMNPVVQQRMVEKVEPRTRQKRDANGNPEFDADGNQVMEELKDATGHVIMKHVKDADGNIVYEPELDEDGNPVMEYVRDESGNVMMEPAFDENGNPIMENYRVIKDDIRKTVLENNSIDNEAGYVQSKVDAARAVVEAQEKALTRKEKRELIRESYQADGKKHPLKWLRSQFFTGSMWKSGYKDRYLSSNTSVAETAAANSARAEIDNIVSNGTREDEVNLDVVSAELYYVKDTVTQELKKAVSQAKITDNLMNKKEEQFIKTSATRAASVYGLTQITAAEYYVAQIRFNNGEISQEELDRIKGDYDAFKNNSVKMTEAQMQNRAYSDNVGNPQTSRPRGAVDFKDKKVEDEER